MKKHWKPEIIPGFKALEFKEQAQARVQAELAGLSGEEKLRKINEMVETGPLGDWYRSMRAAQEARRIQKDARND